VGGLLEKAGKKYLTAEGNVPANADASKVPRPVPANKNFLSSETIKHLVWTLQGHCQARPAENRGTSKPLPAVRLPF
jgi:hypothetical protein